MFRKANNVFSVILDDETILSTALPAAGTVMTDANLPNGAIAAVDLGMRLLNAVTYNALSDSDQFMVIQGKGAGNPMVKSPVLTKGKVKITSAAHVASKQQITAIGYNGTTGSLPAANNTSYYVKIRKNDNDAANRSQPFSLFGQYETSGSATQEELAEGLALNLVKNLSLEPANRYIDVDVLMDEAGVVTTGTTTTYTVTYNSTVVGIDGTLTNVVVGDYVRLEGTTVASPVYKVTAYTASGSIVLDRPYTGATGTVAMANARVIASATAVAAEFGIRLRGTEASFDVNKFRNFYVNRFTATFSDEDTLVTHVQGAREGVGVWQRVALDEYMSYGFDGMNGMIGVPPTLRDQVVKIPGVGGATAAKAKYSVVNISWTEDIDGLVSKAGGKGNVLAYVNLDGSGNLGGAGSTGEAFVTVFGITAANLDEV